MAILGLGSFGAKAQTYTIQNNENCDITVTAWCSDITTCKKSMIVGPISVPFGTSGMITPAACGASGEVTFEVCWNSSLCSPQPCVTFTTVCNPHCNPTIGICGAPSSVTLPGCSDCSSPNPNGTITMTSSTNILVQ